ncbi:MAG: hypothetical protein ACLS76_18640, partial [Eubacterium callanderi]
MRKKQGLLAVIALLFIVILGGCGGDTTQSDLERTAEQFNAAPADTHETYTFSTGGAIRFNA